MRELGIDGENAAVPELRPLYDEHRWYAKYSLKLMQDYRKFPEPALVPECF